MLSVSVVMFAYNEEENIALCMEEAVAFLRSSTADFELIVVDDGSDDATAQAAGAVAATDPEHIKVLAYQPNRGIGGALKTGFAAASKDWVSLLPADGQVPPDGLENLFAVVRADPEVGVVTCHFPRRFQQADHIGRKLLSRGLRGILWLATGVHRKLDGVYLIKREIVQSLPLRSETFFLNLELPIRAIRDGHKAGEATMDIRPRMAGESKVLGTSRIRRVLSETLQLGTELRNPWRSSGPPGGQQ